MTPEIWALLDAYCAFDAHGVLPAPGAFEDQSRVFLRWKRVIDSERARIDEERRPRQRGVPAPASMEDA